MQSYATLFFVSFILCIIIILSSGYGFSRRGQVDELAIQSAHSGFVPRVGGLAIYTSILVLIPLLSFGFIPLSIVFDLDAKLITLLILSAAPVFSVGLAEDLGYNMSPRARLVASAFSSLVAILLFKVWLDSLGIPGVARFSCLHLWNSIQSSQRWVLLTPLTLTPQRPVKLRDGLCCILFINHCFSSRNTSLIFLVLVIAAVLGFMVLNFPLGIIF